jgi:NAD(P)-dependent dehydrogenase (short-subunit alcohol dehydrogenase family)
MRSTPHASPHQVQPPDLFADIQKILEPSVSDVQGSASGLLAGKCVVVTGAGGGIGKVTAQVCVREGAKVLVADISGGEEQVARDLGPSAVSFNVDLKDEEQIAAMFAHARDVFGRVDASIHVAGTPGGRRGEVTIEEYEELSVVNLRGSLLCTKHAVKAMIPTGGGSIVNVSSVASLNAADFNSVVYSAAKAGLNSVTKSFAVLHGPDNIRVNAIAPGFTLSDKNRAAPREAIEKLEKKAALGRAGLPEEQAYVAAFLASDRASFVSGTIIPVDGGWTARLA